MYSEYKEQKEREKFIEEVVSFVKAEFERRRTERLLLERQWELNLNFLSGKQYVDIDGRGELIEEEKAYYWQRKEVFNHVAPILESRLAKLSKISPVFTVRPRSDSDSDAIDAEISEKLLSSVREGAKLEQTVRTATAWSESCGTAFYKVIWDNDGGNVVGEVDGKAVYEGGISFLALSPFEMFPDNLYLENLSEQPSVIHAKAVGVSEIKSLYGVDVLGEEVNVFSLPVMKKAVGANVKTTRTDCAVVIEYYEKPTANFPEGRMITVAGDKLLYYGSLPYKNGEFGKREYPFIKQEAFKNIGCFFAGSIVERLIPVQRAYNAVKNRKHEFINRLTAGVMTVEDGSVDVDDLACEGLSPGKILVYRQGSKAPEIMPEPTFPAEFSEEETKLLDEFVIISGTSDLNSSSENAGVTSGSALQILIEQDNERLAVNAKAIRNCYVLIAKHILRLYSQHVKSVRAIKTVGETGKITMQITSVPKVPSDDVVIDNENELGQSSSQKRQTVMALYESGLLADKDGKVSDYVKEKVLALLGYKDLDGRKGISRLHEEKAQNENAVIRESGKEVDIIDDDAVHEFEHTRYILSEYASLTQDEKERLFKHVASHREKMAKNQKEKKEN